MSDNEIITNNLLEVENAASALRASVPVVSYGEESSFYLIHAVENCDKESLERFDKISEAPISLVISAKRAEILSANKKFKNAVLVNSDKINLREIYSLAGLSGEIIKNIPVMKEADKNIAATIILAKIAEILPALFISSITKKAVEELCKKYVKVSVSSIKSYEKDSVQMLREVCSAPLKLAACGDAEIKVFQSVGKEHYAIIVGNPETQDSPMVRIHSSCFTGDLLGSLKCDCREQLHGALEYMKKNGGGVLLYLMQEGRGIGLVNKLRAYKLQSDGMDTVEANEFLGFEDDERPYLLAAEIMKRIGLKKIKLITNNPRKMKGLADYGIKVTKRVSLIIEPHEHNDSYLETKFTRLGHLSEK